MYKLGDQNSGIKALQKLIWDLWEIQCAITKLRFQIHMEIALYSVLFSKLASCYITHPSLVAVSTLMTVMFK